MKYQDFVIEVTNAVVAKDISKVWRRTLDVRVMRTDAFGDAPSKWISTGCEELPLKDMLRALEDRTLDRDGLFGLGKVLSLLLMPTGDGISGVRELFARSVEIAANADAGIRLRLVLPPELASLPWEYLYLDRTGGNEDTMNGFIGLDPRIAIVRHEALPMSAQVKPIEGDISVLAALASPDGLEPLDLANEERLIRNAVADRAGLTLRVLTDATLLGLAPLLAGSQVFHFAGHGAFEEGPGSEPGELVGNGMLAFDDEMVEAEQLGVNLRGNGIRLAVLAGCETGRRVGKYTAGSVAVGLVRSEIPAVVANQYAILDTSAVAFSRGFYTALDGGLPLEQAMHAGRLAVFNGNKESRDWGVPVLYMRARSGDFFAGAADAEVRAAAKSSSEASVVVRSRNVAAGGFVTGAKLRKMLDGKLDVEVSIAGTVYGKVVGLRAGDLRGGSVNVTVDADTVGDGGVVIGADLDSIGKAAVEPARKPIAPPAPLSFPRAIPQKSRAAPDPAPASSPARRSAPPAAPASSSTVNVENLNGGTAIGTQYNYTTFTQATQPDPDTGLIQEELRLDVGSARTATLEEPFELVVQIRTPGSPPLAVADVDQVTSADGSIFRREASEIVHYKIVPGGDGFTFDPPSIRLQLLPNNESKPVRFEAISHKPGKRKLRVNAFQDDETLAAQTFLTLDIAIATQ